MAYFVFYWLFFDIIYAIIILGDTMSKVLLILGSLLLVNGLALCFFTNIHTGIILTVLLGLFFVLWGIFYKYIKKITKLPILKTLKFFVVLLLFIELIFVCFLGVYGGQDTVTYTEDAVIVLGAGIKGDKVTPSLKLRLDKAVEYHNKNKTALIVVSGGQGPQEMVAEAFAMEKYLINNGVDGSVIVKEEKATSTDENMLFSKQILDKRLKADYKVAVITNDYHIYRSVNIAGDSGFENVTSLHASQNFYNAVPNYLRESLAVIKMWLTK